MKVLKEKKKKSSKHAWGWFVHPNPGDPETMARFNNSADTSAAPVSGAGDSGACGESLQEDVQHGNALSDITCDVFRKLDVRIKDYIINDILNSYGTDPFDEEELDNLFKISFLYDDADNRILCINYWDGGSQIDHDFITDKDDIEKIFDACQNGLRTKITKDFMSEDIGVGYNRQQLFDAIRKYGVDYKLDKYTNQQLYRILNRLHDKKLKNDEANKEYEKKKSITTNKSYDDDSKYSYLGNVNGKNIYMNKVTGDYGVEGYKIRFATEDDAVDFAKQ